MSELAKAYVQIIPTSQGMGEELKKIFDNDATSAGKSSGLSFGNAMGTGIKAAGATIAAAGTAIAGMATSFVSATGAVADYGDNIDKMSQKMGLTAEAYQEWDAVMQHSGTSMETMKSSMKTLANAAETGNKAFAELGITEEQIASMNQQELFEATIAGLQNVTDDTQRTYLAGKLLGKGATELGALLNTSAEDTQAMRDRVRELGGVMSEDAVKAAAAYQDQLQDMQTAFQGLSRNLMSEFLPDMTNVMAGLTEIFAGNSESGLGMISEGISSLVSGITEKLPQITETGIKILESLATAILDNLPKLMDAGMNILNEVVKYIIQSLPQLIETGLQVIVQLALGIAQALPELIPTAIETVLTIVEGLLDNIDMLIDAAIKLIIGLAEGLINALPKLIEKGPIIVGKLVTALIQAAPQLAKASLEIIVKMANGILNNAPKILQAGKQIISQLFNALVSAVQTFVNIGSDIVAGIKNGISNAWNNLVSWFKGLFGDLIQIAKDILGIASPSKVFEQIGEYTTEGFDEGMADFGKGAMEDVQTAMDDISNIKPNIDPATLKSNIKTDYSVATTTTAPDIDRKLDTLISLLSGGVNVTLEGDAQGLFRQVRKEVNQFTRSTGNSPFIAPA